MGIRLKGVNPTGTIKVGKLNKNPQNIYVSDNGSDSNDGLTRETPVRTLSTASTKANNNGIFYIKVIGNFTNTISECVTSNVTILSDDLNNPSIISGTNMFPQHTVFENVYINISYFDLRYDITNNEIYFKSCSIDLTTGDYFKGIGGHFYANSFIRGLKVYFEDCQFISLPDFGSYAYSPGPKAYFRNCNVSSTTNFTVLTWGSREPWTFYDY